uniref:Uncharacterized protein n=1 Tax=Cannabis sativa TaxID=3483 RepID=A0A803QBA6_CANSA
MELTEELRQRIAFYEIFSKEELQVEGLVITQLLHQYGLISTLQRIHDVNGRGQPQTLSDLKEQIALDLSVAITKAAKDEELLAAAWDNHHPDPLTEEEEIRARFRGAYPKASTFGASTSGRDSNDPWRGGSGAVKALAPSNIDPTNREPRLPSDKEDSAEGLVFPQSNTSLKYSNTAPHPGREDKRAKHSTLKHSKSGRARSLLAGG